MPARKYKTDPAQLLAEGRQIVHTTSDVKYRHFEQPYVRPIQREKRPNPTEFGQKLYLSVVDDYIFLEQTSWSNFNEGGDLQAAVEDYRRKFGCYPNVVLSDKIY